MTSGFFGGAWEGGEVPGYNWLFSLPSFSLLAFFFFIAEKRNRKEPIGKSAAVLK